MLLPVVAYEPVADTKLFTFWSFEDVYALNDDVVTKSPALPLLSGITIPNVDASPFVNVKVFPAKDAVTNDDAVTDELTKPNEVIC